MCNSLIPAAYRGSGTNGSTAPGGSGRQDFPPAPEPLPVPVMDNHTHLDFPDGEAPVGVAAALDAL
jgi:TatD DNase family protein